VRNVLVDTRTLLRVLIWRYVGFYSDNRLNPGFCRRFKEFDRAVERRMIGNAIASYPCSLARATRSPTSPIASNSEYIEWTWRWTNGDFGISATGVAEEWSAMNIAPADGARPAGARYEFESIVTDGFSPCNSQKIPRCFGGFLLYSSSSSAFPFFDLRFSFFSSEDWRKERSVRPPSASMPR
jgi:hypothetical protein